MCNCIKEVENRLKELSTKNKDWKGRAVTHVSIENEAFMLGGSCSTKLYSPVKIEYDYLNKKGEKKHKKSKIDLSYSYCPFCGKKY